MILVAGSISEAKGMKMKADWSSYMGGLLRCETIVSRTLGAASAPSA